MIESGKIDIQPGVLRIIIQRLGRWLPIGPIAVRGDGVDIEAGLRRSGYDLEPRDQIAAVVLVISACDQGEIDSRLDEMVQHIDRVPVCVVVWGTVDSVSRASWERAMLCRQWRKHPLNEVVAPYGELDRVTGLVMSAFEPLPDDVAAAYPLQALVEERDLHTDMTREAGRRSDAHLARYAQAARFVNDGDRVIDVACGLGYGSYLIARSTRAASVTGLDLSDYAIDYAKTSFSRAVVGAPRFRIGDAQDLSHMTDGSADFAISVETLEHIPEPTRLLSELHRVLVPGGLLYASVPNDWSDESGEDPNPFHLHVYRWESLSEQFRVAGFSIERAWLQDAGGGQKRHLAARSMLELDPRRGPQCDGEWLLVLARRVTTDETSTAEPRIATVEELLVAGRRQEAILALTAAMEDVSDPLRRAASAVELAALHASSGDAQRAQVLWEESVGLSSSLLEEPALRRGAAVLLALACDALDNDLLSMPTLFGRHPAAMAQLGRAVCETSIDLVDRAFFEGTAAEFDPLGMTPGQIRESIEAKRWLEAKYHEQGERIVELEEYTTQLEQARRWLDGQYHSLTDEIQRLRRTDTSQGP